MQRPAITGFQRGNKVILSWKMPAKNADRGNTLRIERADIYRLAESLASPQTLSEAEFASRSTIVASLAIGDDDFGGKSLQFTDTLQFAGQPVRLRYAVRFVNGSGQKAAFSNFFLLEPAAKVASPPDNLEAEVSQTAINLKWQSPEVNVDGTTPPNILGYNVYRSVSKTVPAKLLTTSPVKEQEFDDEFFDFGHTYYYFVRTISLGTSGDNIESSESNIVTVSPVDTFPPTPPASLTIAATPTSISIFFPSNPEKDIKGYHIYRSTDPDLPREKWERLTKELSDVSTYEDKDVTSGTVYYYYATATDTSGNISDASEVVSEKVP